MNNKLFLRITLFIFIFTILVFVVLSRAFSQRELDDVHPFLVDSSDPLVQDSGWLWVIPYYRGEAITNHPQWVRDIKESGKNLGLHGVYHTFNEFGSPLSDEHIDKGIDEFERAFGFKPGFFKAPRLSLHKENLKKLKERGLQIRGRINQIIHTVYHPSPSA